RPPAARRPPRGSALAPYTPDPSIGELGAHAPQARANAALHRSLGLFQPGGDLAVGEAAEVRQFDGPALVGRQPVEHRLHLLAHGEVEHLVLDVVARLRRPSRLAFLTSPP